jgi:pilus assembly protein CpaB
MNPRMMIVVVLAVVCGLSAMVLVQTLQQPAGPVVEKVAVVIASVDIQPGETIQESMLETHELPKTEAPEDSIHSPADAVGRAAMAQLDKGDLIREKKLAERGAGHGMAARIKSGMRAITIPTPSLASSMAGFLLPGNRVDILLTTSSSGRTEDEPGGATTTELLQNVEILAVHTTVNSPTSNRIDPEQARSVTVQVTPNDANRLQLAQAKGTLSLSLRNLKDIGSETSRPANLADIQQSSPKPPVVAAPPSPPAPVDPAKPPPGTTRPDLASTIPPGMRAFTITTPSNSRSLVRTIRAGHRVDVLLTLNLKPAASSVDAEQDEPEFQGVTSTLLRNQEVLEIHPTIDPNSSMMGSSEEARALTLLVTPRDAELLELAENAGRLHLALRPERSDDPADEGPPPDPVTNADLLLGGRKPRQLPFSTVTLEVRTLRGTAIGANTMTYFVPRSPDGQGQTPRSSTTPAPDPSPTPSTVVKPNFARIDRRTGAASGRPGPAEGRGSPP